MFYHVLSSDLALAISPAEMRQVGCPAWIPKRPLMNQMARRQTAPSPQSAEARGKMTNAGKCKDPLKPLKRVEEVVAGTTTLFFGQR